MEVPFWRGVVTKHWACDLKQYRKFHAILVKSYLELARAVPDGDIATGGGRGNELGHGGGA